MLSLKKQSGLLKIILTDDIGRSRITNYNQFDWLCEREQRALLTPAIDYFNGRTYVTQIGVFQHISMLGRIMRPLGWKQLPLGDANWQSDILTIFSAWLTQSGRSKLSTRSQIWNLILAPYLELLRDAANLIPLSVSVPRVRSNVTGDDLKAHGSQVSFDDPFSPPKVEKILVSINFARKDADYLDEIRDDLSHRRKLLDDCSQQWWEQIEAHFQFGQSLIDQTDWPALKRRIKLGKFREYRFDPVAPGQYHIANCDTEKSLGFFLTIVSKKYDSLLTKSLLESAPGLPHLSTINIANTAPAPVSNRIQPLQRLNWMLGNLSPTDIGFAFLYITMHNPRLTPSALARSKVVSKSGKTYFENTDIGLIFRADKQRSHAMKESILDDKSQWLFQLIFEMTHVQRTNLAKTNPQLANYFFLLSDRGTCRLINQDHPIGPLAGDLSSANEIGADSDDPRNWAGSYFPHLLDAGLKRGSITLRKVRASEGVLEWFRTGSIAAMARKLGNSQRVSIEYYLPKSLLDAWNIRLLRRFQNLWLAVATADTDFQLQVTDFTRLEDLHIFLFQMLDAHPDGSSPLANELHKRIGTSLLTAGRKARTRTKAGQVCIPASSQVFLSLYLYQEAAIEAGLKPEILDTPDSVTHLSPHQIVSIAELVRFRAPDDKDPVIRAAHATAMGLLPSAKKTIQWTELLVKWGEYRGSTS